MIRPGDVVLAALPQADGSSKLRPVLILAELPGRFDDLLVCGISSQVHQFVPEWDESIESSSTDFLASGLRLPSIARLSFLAVVPSGQTAGGIGRIASERLSRLLMRLSRYLAKS